MLNWFLDAKWYNIINYKDITEEIMAVFIHNGFISDKIVEEVSEKIYATDFFSDLIGTFGEWSSVDKVDYFEIEGIDVIIKNDENSNIYTLILDVPVSFQTYSDHDFYDNGSTQTYVAVRGQINKDNSFCISNVEYLGCKRAIDGFSFK